MNNPNHKVPKESKLKKKVQKKLKNVKDKINKIKFINVFKKKKIEVLELDKKPNLQPLAEIPTAVTLDERIYDGMSSIIDDDNIDESIG